MNNFIKYFLYASLLLGALGLNSCSDKVELSPGKEPGIEMNPTSASATGAYKSYPGCIDCDNLVSNGSFENYSGSIGTSNRLSILYNQVSPWYEVRGTPNIMDGNIPMTSSMYTNPGFAGTHILHMNENPYQDPDLGEAAAIDVDVFSDRDLSYCLSFRYARGIRLSDNSPVPPGRIEARLADGVPQSDQKPEIQWTNYPNQFIGNPSASTTWQLASYQFTVGQTYSQLIFDAQSINTGSGSVTRVLLDDVMLTCQSNALQGINATSIANGTITLSPDFQGLPPNVNIVEYEWSGISQNASGNGPTITVPLSSQPLIFCLKIKDSRGCCSSICDTILICDSLYLSSCCTLDVGSGGGSVLADSKNRTDALNAISASSLNRGTTINAAAPACDPCVESWYPVWVEEGNGSPIGLANDPCYVVEWFDDQGTLLFTGWAFAADVDKNYTVRVTNSCKGCIWEETFSYSCCQVPAKTLCSYDRNGLSTLSWLPVAGATGYQIQITINDPSCCIRPNNQPISLNLLNIPAGTNSYTSPISYNCASWSVRAVCANGNYSDFSSPQCICAGYVSKE